MRHTTIIAAVALATAAACDESTPPRGPGAIFISSSASVTEPSAFFEYRIRVDGGTPTVVPMFQPASFQVNGLAAGPHTVDIEGLPAACNAGAARRNVTLQGGDTALVVFNIACARVTGDINVSVATTGSDVDTDGYFVTLNQSVRGIVGPNGQTTVGFVPAGSHSVALSGVAPNCTAGNPQTVSVVAAQVSTVAFQVTCTQVGILKVTGDMSGTDRDADGVTLRVGQGSPMRLRAGTSHIRVPLGAVTWQLGDVQPNCTLSGPSSGSATLAAGDTVTVSTAGTCNAVGYGVATTVANDPAADTLPNTASGPVAAYDLRQVTTRYASNWLILVLRFSRPVPSVGQQAAAGLQGYIELDTDENTSTGFAPVANSFGGSAQQGVDYGLILFEGTSSTVRLRKASASDSTTHNVPMALEGDSMVVRIPLAKLGGDDGNMSISATLGTTDRPTDIVPNSGVILGRQPTSPIIVNGDGPTREPQRPAHKRAVSWPMK